LIFVGDFNCPQSHTVFIPKENGLPVNSGQPENFVETRSQKGKYLASEYDNMFYNTPPKLIELIKGVFLLQEFRFPKRRE
jgi:hypothetical protein